MGRIGNTRNDAGLRRDTRGGGIDGMSMRRSRRLPFSGEGSPLGITPDEQSLFDLDAQRDSTVFDTVTEPLRRLWIVLAVLACTARMDANPADRSSVQLHRRVRDYRGHILPMPRPRPGEQICF